MGLIKSGLSLQMIPWCFHVSGGGGDGERRSNPSSPARCVRLIGSDGRVKVYHRAVSAAELMREYPRHLICRSDSFHIGRVVPALSASDDLQPGHSYFLLPTHFFHSVLSFVTAASSLMTIKPNPGPATALRPFDIHKTAAGTLQIRFSEEVLDKIMEGEEEEESKAGCGCGDEGDAKAYKMMKMKVCTTEALEKEYRQLVRCKSSKWKPRLETISESSTKDIRRNTGRVGWIRRGRGLAGLKRRKMKKASS